MLNTMRKKGEKKKGGVGEGPPFRTDWPGDQDSEQVAVCVCVCVCTSEVGRKP
jgi:hypothetical protein